MVVYPSQCSSTNLLHLFKMIFNQRHTCFKLLYLLGKLSLYSDSFHLNEDILSSSISYISKVMPVFFHSILKHVFSQFFTFNFFVPLNFSCASYYFWLQGRGGMRGSEDRHGRIFKWQNTGKWEGRASRTKSLFKDIGQKMKPKQDSSLFHLESLLSTAGLDNVSHSWKEKKWGLTKSNNLPK